MGDAEGDGAGDAAEDEGKLDEAKGALQAKPTFFKGPEPFAEGGDGPGRETEEWKSDGGFPTDRLGWYVMEARVRNSCQNDEGSPCGDPGAEETDAQADEPGDEGGAIVEHGGRLGGGRRITNGYEWALLLYPEVSFFRWDMGV